MTRGHSSLARRLTLPEALASDRLEDFVRQEEARGEVLAKGSDLERALSLLITQRRRNQTPEATLDRQRYWRGSPAPP
jgi:hypothetical protein